MQALSILAAVALAASLPALAQNKGGGSTASSGVVTIDQARAEAGGVTPGDAPGFPVTLSQPGRYRLTANLTIADANTSGIVITAPNVTLDLDGFTIAGPVTCAAYASPPTVCSGTGNGDGIAVVLADYNARAAILVANGTVRGMGRHGVHANSSFDGFRVERLFALNNGNAGLLVNGGAISDSQSSFNGQSGIRGNNLLLVNNVVRSNGSYGISVNFSSAGVHNVVQGNPVDVASGGMRNLGPNLCGTTSCP
jgi:hypothetical protein